MIVGIDNGLDGGITVLREDCSIISTRPMPVKRVGKGRVVDIVAISNLFVLVPKDSIFLLEQAAKFSQGKMALCSTWFTFGKIEALLELQQYRYELVQPQKWQRTFWARPKMPTGQKFDTKAAAKVAANRLWPEQDWTKSERASIPHDGMIDSALIAEYGRRIFAGQFDAKG